METELERLVIRLVGDVSQYVESLREAKDATTSSVDGVIKELESVQARAKQITDSLRTPLEVYQDNLIELEDLLKQGHITQETFDRGVEKLGKDLEKATEEVNLFETSIKALAGSMAALGAKSWLTQALHEWQVAETTALKLNATLQSNGRNVNNLSNDYKKFASEIQKISTFGDDAVISMLQQAETFGLTGEKAKRAVENTLAAQSNGLQVSLRMMAMLEQGNTYMLGRILPGLRGIKDESERAAKAQEMLAKMQSVLRAEAESSAGKLKQLKNNYGDLMEQIGEVVANAMSPFVELLNVIVLSLQELSPEVKTAAVGIAALSVAFVAVATTGPLVTAAIGSITASVVSLTTAIAASPLAPLLLAAAAIVAIGYAISASNDQYERAKQIHEESAKSVARHREEMSRLHQEMLKRSTTESRVEFLAGQLNAVVELYARATENVQKAKKKFIEAHFFGGRELPEEEIRYSLADESFTRWEAGFISPDALAEMQAAEEQVEALNKSIQQIKEEIANQQDFTGDTPLNRYVDELNKSLEDAGKTADEIKIGELRSQGASEEQLELVRILQEEVK
ncbi:MAG: hypothetical protein QXZ57_07200, partial [Nitrososphaerota archaeon]